MQSASCYRDAVIRAQRQAVNNGLQHRGVPKILSPRERSPFGLRLWKARERAGLTQMEVRKRLDISQGTLSDLERTGLSSGLVAQFAQLYRVDVHWLATGVGEEPDWDNAAPPPSDDRRIPLLLATFAAVDERRKRAICAFAEQMRGPGGDILLSMFNLEPQRTGEPNEAPVRVQ